MGLWEFFAGRWEPSNEPRPPRVRTRCPQRLGRSQARRARRRFEAPPQGETILDLFHLFNLKAEQAQAARATPRTPKQKHARHGDGVYDLAAVDLVALIREVMAMKRNLVRPLLATMDMDDIRADLVVHLLSRKEHDGSRYDPTRGCVRAWACLCIGSKLSNMLAKMNTSTRVSLADDDDLCRSAHHTDSGPWNEDAAIDLLESRTRAVTTSVRSVNSSDGLGVWRRTRVSR